jgi:predicted NodU family carbamoyl transferase
MDLFLTLGHNSSAVGRFSDGSIIGYEEERFDKKKATSAFPITSIKEILSRHDFTQEKQNRVFISHWFNDFNFFKNEQVKKYFDFEYFSSLVNDFKFDVISLNKDLTHHDAHAHSALAFFNSHASEEDKKEDYTVFVTDGFGNNGEVLSIYSFNQINGLKLINRIYGYENSLGLLYQYATAYVGMKEMRDEYKFLGYESKIHLLYDYTEIIHILGLADEFSDSLIKEFERSQVFEKKEEIIDLNGLNQARRFFYNNFDSLCNSVKINSVYDKRVVIGYYVQSILEKVHSYLLDKYKVKNLILNGGVYYNVKLNNHILNTIKGKLCINPLAGDQGNALGLSHDFELKGLCWGERTLKPFTSERTDIEYIDNEEAYVEKVYRKLINNEVVNVVTGSMEFGPRALCNTSTLALPLSNNVDFINSINHRNTVMPMAPVLKKENLPFLFNNQFNRVIGSDKYMIITYNYTPYTPIEMYRGVMHNYPLSDEWFSGRPQVIDDKSTAIYKILSKLDDDGWKAIINTSYNTHGRPINYSINDCLEDFDNQINVAKDKGLLNARRLSLVVYG